MDFKPTKVRTKNMASVDEAQTLIDSMVEITETSVSGISIAFSFITFYFLYKALRKFI